MAELRKTLHLRGLSLRTQGAYVRAVRQLANRYHKSPDLISDKELRQYFLHIKNVKKYSIILDYRNLRIKFSCGSPELGSHLLI